MTQTTFPKSHSLFFYGTLMAPSVLHRVISSTSTPSISSSHSRTEPPLSFYPALLPHHRRRHVKKADYPAVTPAPNSSVRGTMVCGLTDRDVAKLDLFEGDEYERRAVKVRLLPASVEDGGGVPEPLAYGGITPVVPRHTSSAPSSTQVNGTNEHPRGSEVTGVDETVEGEEWATTQTYIWTAPASDLEEAEWDFEHFRREKLHLWAGSEVGDSGMEAADKLERDAARNGQADSTRGRGVQGGEFERALREKEDQERSANRW